MESDETARRYRDEARRLNRTVGRLALVGLSLSFLVRAIDAGVVDWVLFVAWTPLALTGQAAGIDWSSASFHVAATSAGVR